MSDPLPAARSQVQLGTSFNRAIARKSGNTAPGKKPLHPREFYSVRYNFRPPSVDEVGRGKVTVDSSNVTIERPSTQSSESHRWIGSEKPAKEWDCILIYDEANESYTLEKLESVVTLTHQPRLNINEAPVLAKQTPTADEIADELERELLEAVVDQGKKGKAVAKMGADADGEDYFDEIVPDDRREEEEEEEEGELVQSPPRPSSNRPPARKKPASPPLPPPTKPPVKPAPAPPKAAVRPKPPPKPTPAPAPAPAPAPIPIAKPKPTPAPPPPQPTSSSTAPKPRPKPVPLPRGKKHKREPEPAPPTTSHHLSDAEEEFLDFGQPTKRARVSPPRSQGLALPSASTAVFIPPPPPSALPAAPTEPVEVGSESEEEWDQVATVGEEVKTVETEDDFDIFGDAAGAGDETMDIGMDELEREINLHMDEEDGEEEEEDFLASVVEEAPPSRGAPVSLKELANGASYASDDDYSSSDESDDD